MTPPDSEAQRFYLDLWEMFGEVPAATILRKIDREWPSDRLRLLLESMRRAVTQIAAVPQRRRGLEEVIELLEQRLA